MSENVIKDDQNITLIFQREQEVKCLFFKSEHRAKVLYDSKDKCCNKLVKEYPLISAIVEGSTIESDNLWLELHKYKLSFQMSVSSFAIHIFRLYVTSYRIEYIRGMRRGWVTVTPLLARYL